MGFGEAFDAAEFLQRLAEVVAWCASPESATVDVGPWRALRRVPAPFELAFTETVEAAAVIRARRLEFLTDDAVTAARESLATAGGQLVVFVPDGSLSDGAAVRDSKGFFDDHNTPTAASWVAVYGESQPNITGAVIIAWAPPSIRDGVREGVYINPEYCITLLGDGRHDVWPQVKAASGVAPESMLASPGWQDAR